MKKCLFFFTFMISFVCKGQKGITNTKPAMILSDNSRKNFSTLDLFYLIAKSINPNSAVLANKDTLLVVFDLPPWIRLSDSLIHEYCKTYFDALSIHLKKDSAKYKWFAVQVCNDPWHCSTAWYETSTLKWKNSSFQEKVQWFLQANFHQGIASTAEKSNGKMAMIVRYFIDTTFDYTQFNYIHSFYQSSSAVMADLIYKSPKNIRKQYDELITLFCDKENRLLYFWRLPITDEQLSALYKLKFYESNQKFNLPQR